MKKLSAKKLQLSFFLTFGSLIISLILLSFGIQQLGLAFFVLAFLGITVMMMSGQCPNCKDARSAKWLNPFTAKRDMYCTRCGQKMEIEDDGWIRLRYKEDKKRK